MKKSLRVLSSLLAVLLLVSALSCFASATNNQTFTTAPEIYTYVRDGYNQGSLGPISITKGTLKSGWSSKTVYLVTLSGTELVLNQSTGVFTDLLSGFNLDNVYYANTVNIILANVPRNANLIIAGHSLGGMIAQQVAANSSIKSNYNVLNTVCFGSPLLAAGSREGTVRRLGDVSDPVPYLSGSLFNNTLWAILGLNREDGGYGIRGITAHNESYYRADLWGAYDVTGTKYGSAKLILDLDTRTFYQSPVIDW
jgi:pimeloyl-ACP methyl ester carboxylesterase